MHLAYLCSEYHKTQAYENIFHLFSNFSELIIGDLAPRAFYKYKLSENNWSLRRFQYTKLGYFNFYNIWKLFIKWLSKVVLRTKKAFANISNL